MFLRFKPPTDDGGATVSYRFRVKEGVGAFGNWTNIAEADLQAQSGGGLGFPVVGLTTIDHAERTVPSGYSFEVQAVNSAGQGPASQAGVTPYRYRFEITARNWTQSQTADGFEEGSTVGFTLSIKTTPSLNCPFESPTTTRWTATDAGGFVSGPKSGNQTFAACQASVNLDVPTEDDVDNEAAHGEVTVALSGAGVIHDEPGPAVCRRHAAVADVHGAGRRRRPADAADGPDGGARREPGQPGLDGGRPGRRRRRHQAPVLPEGGAPAGAAPTDWTDIPDSAPDGANATSFTVTDLDNGTTYTFRVRAVNPHGEGAASNAKSATPREVTPPGRPTRPAPGSGDGEVTLQWGPPEDDGGRPVLGYEYRRRCSGSSDPECEWEPIPNSAPGEANEESYTIGNLQNDGRYVYQVRAVNERGQGPHVQLEMRPQAGAPPTPGNFRVQSHPPRSLRLSWTEPQAGPGITILAYGVHRQDNDSGGLYAPGLTEFISGFGPQAGHALLPHPDDLRVGGRGARAGRILAVEVRDRRGRTRRGRAGGHRRLDRRGARKQGHRHRVPRVAHDGGRRDGHGDLPDQRRDGQGRGGLRGDERHADLRAGGDPPDGDGAADRRPHRGPLGDLHTGAGVGHRRGDAPCGGDRHGP